MAVDDIADAHYRAQQKISRQTAQQAQALWSAVEPRAVLGTWTGQLAAMLRVLILGQTRAASLANPYVDALATQQGIPAPARVNPRAFAGTAADGRSLTGLLMQPALRTLGLLTRGADDQTALLSGLASLTRIVDTEVADASRAADHVGIVGTKTWVTYVRNVSLPACGRCIILAGREYSWSQGFARHERCDCTMVPRREGDEPLATPEQLFAAMTPEEQARSFTIAGAEAIRLGADLGQVVNARRGMKTVGDRLLTTEGTTLRGFAGRRMGPNAQRLMPEQILADANGDRDLAVQLLERNGFLLAPSPAVTRKRAEEKAAAEQARLESELAAEQARLDAEAAAERARAEAEAAAEQVRVAAEQAHIEAERIEAERLEAERAAREKTAADQLAKKQAAESKPKPQPTTTPAAVPDRARDHHINLNGIETLAHAVESGFPPKTRRALTGGVSADTELITLKDGTKVVWKSGGNPDAEQAASMIARAIGIRAPGVYRNHPSAVYMEYIDDAMTATELQENHPGEWEKRQRASIDHDDGNLVGLLDALISNADRNTGNWMVTEDGRTIPIDHGHAFTGVPSGRIRVRKVQGDGPFAENYRLNGPNPLTQADVTELRGRLEALAPEFAHMGRSKWLEYSLGVLDLLAKDAGGYSNMIAGVR